MYLQGEQVNIKKYLYVLRPVLACQWIECSNTMPPMEFDTLVEELVPAGSELKAVIQELLIRKAGDELDCQPRIYLLNDFLTKTRLLIMRRQPLQYLPQRRLGTRSWMSCSARSA